MLTIIAIPTCVGEAAIHPSTLPGITISHESIIKFLTSGVKLRSSCGGLVIFLPAPAPADFSADAAGGLISEDDDIGMKISIVNPKILSARPKNHHLWHSMNSSWAHVVTHIPIASNLSNYKKSALHRWLFSSF